MRDSHTKNNKQPQTFILIPIAIDERQKQLQPPQLSWWTSWMSWLRYQSIQLRWDIERSLARILHRPWRG